MGAERIVILGGGSLHGLVRALRVGIRVTTVELFGTGPHPVEELGVEVWYGPKFEDSEFSPTLLGRLESGTGVVIPCTDRGMLALSALRGAVEDETSYLCAVANVLTCSYLNDKEMAKGVFMAWGIPTPTQRCGYPRFIKPSRGRSSIHAMRVDTPGQEQAYRLLFHEPCVVQRLVEGQEYSVDAYIGRDRTVKYCVPRARLKTFGGVSVVTETVELPKARETVEKLAATPWWPQGPMTVQGFMEDGEFVVIECKCRIGSGIVCG